MDTAIHKELINLNHVTRVRLSHTGKVQIRFVEGVEITIEEPREYIKNEIERLRK
jgi:hypothetical protein